MKIIQICAAYKPAYIYGGPTMSVAKLSEELSKSGLDVTVLATSANGESELNVPLGKKQIVDGVPVYYFKRWTKDHSHFSPALYYFLHKQISQQKKAGASNELIIHIHAWWNLVSIFSCLIAKLHGIRVVLSPRGMLNSYTLTSSKSTIKSLIHETIGKWLLKSCHIHATSDKEKRDILQTCKVKGITVIHNFVALPHTPLSQENITEEQQTTFKLLFLSRVEEKKGIEFLFEALSELSIPCSLSIAGNGTDTYTRHLKLLASKLNIEAKIEWLGHVNNEHKFELIKSHDLFALTSYNENFANVVIESLSVGTAVLISNEVGLADYVIENDFGKVVQLENREIIDGIKELYQDIEKRAYIRKTAPSKIYKDFSEECLSNIYSQAYKNILR